MAVKIYYDKDADLNLLKGKKVAIIGYGNIVLKKMAKDDPQRVYVGHVLEAMPSDGARPMFLDRIACDFPDLKMIGAHTGWPWVDELISVCYKWENIWCGVDAWSPKYLSPQIIQFINSRLGRDRCLWGTNGLPWKESLQQLCDLGLKEQVQKKLLRENAIELFKLEVAKEAPAGLEVTLV